MFYMMVKLGGFRGKRIMDGLGKGMGEEGYMYMKLLCGRMSIVGLVWVVVVYKWGDRGGEGKSMGEIGEGFVGMMRKWGLLIVMVMVSGLWMVEEELYGRMGKYGEEKKIGYVEY